MPNLTPGEYFTTKGSTTLRTARIRFTETDNFDGTKATVDFAGQNDRVVYVTMNKKSEIRISTHTPLNASGQKAKPGEDVASIKTDTDFFPVDYTDYIKKKLGRKYDDILLADAAKADEFITQYVKGLVANKPYYVDTITTIQTPWDPNTVPPIPDGPKKEEQTDTQPKTEPIPEIVEDPVVEEPLPETPTQNVTTSPTASNTKFKITISGSTSDWSDPIEFKDGVDAKTDLPIFHVFIGEEIKYSDPFTDFEDADYDSLDPEYTEEGVQGLLPEEYDLVTNFPEVDVATAAQALFGSYGDSITEESSAQVGWSGPAYWGMTVKEITITAGGKSSTFKVWNTEAVGGDGKLNLFKALVSGGESAGNYYAFNYGTNGSEGLSISSFGFSKGKPIKRTKLFDITMTFDEVRKKQLYETKPGLFAVGKYQAVPTTLNSHIPKLKCGSQQMSPYWQEKLAESLITNRVPLWNYITGKNDGSQSKLEAAITSAGQEWASLPVCKTPDRYDTKITIVNGKKKKNKVLVAKGQIFSIESNPSANAAYYGGVGINPGKSKKNLATVAVILIETRKKYTGSDDFYKPKWYKPLSFSV